MVEGEVLALTGRACPDRHGWVIWRRRGGRYVSHLAASDPQTPESPEEAPRAAQRARVVSVQRGAASA